MPLLGGSSCAAALPWSVEPASAQRVEPALAATLERSEAPTARHEPPPPTPALTIPVSVPVAPAKPESTEPAGPQIDCTPRSANGYQRGKALPLQVVDVDGETVERKTASAFVAMYEAAAADGVNLSIRSAFRTMRAQRWLYRCYRTCSCNGCTKAAKPGHSNHQSGRALDLVLSSPKVHTWLVEHAADFGFRATVRGEPWHWVYNTKRSFADVCRTKNEI